MSDDTPRTLAVRRYGDRVYVTTKEPLEPGHIYELPASEVVIVEKEATAE